MNITNVSISEGQVVDLNGSIKIIFDDIINESTFNNNTVYLLDEYGNRVDVSIEIVDVQTVLVNYNNLKSTTQYTLYILNNTITQDGVQSILGDTLISDYTLTFVTRNVVETDTIIDYTDQNIEDIDISDKPIKLYNQGNAVYWEYNPIKFDGVLTQIFDNQEHQNKFSEIVNIEIEDVYQNPIPVYVFYVVDQNKVNINIVQQDGSILPNNQIVYILLDDDTISKNKELLVITDISPKPVSKIFLKRNLGTLQNDLGDQLFTSIYLEQLIEYEDLQKLPSVTPYSGLVGERKEATEINNQPYLELNTEFAVTQTSNSYEITKDSKQFNIFKNIVLSKILEYFVLNSNNYDRISLENITISYNTESLKKMQDDYKQKQLDLIKKTKRVGPAVAIRGLYGGIDRSKIKTLSRLYSKLNIYRD